jgi:hypothetical protein
VLNLAKYHEKYVVQEAWFQGYLTLSSGACDRRKRETTAVLETSSSTHWTGGWVGQNVGLQF